MKTLSIKFKNEEDYNASGIGDQIVGYKEAAELFPTALKVTEKGDTTTITILRQPSEEELQAVYNA